MIAAEMQPKEMKHKALRNCEIKKRKTRCFAGVCFIILVLWCPTFLWRKVWFLFGLHSMEIRVRFRTMLQQLHRWIKTILVWLGEMLQF